MWRPGGGGSSNLDVNQNDIADSAEAIDDGTGNSATAEEIKDAVAKKHASGSDNQDLSGLVAKEVGKSLVADTEIAKIHTNSLDHVQGTDQGLDTGGANAVTASALKAVIDGTVNGVILGTLDAYSRRQIWNKLSSAILRLGSLQSDGDATNVQSEGIVVYGKNLQGDTISLDDFGYARIKPNRIGIYNSKLSGYVGYIIKFDGTEDEWYITDNSGNKKFKLYRSTGQLVLSSLSDGANVVIIADIKETIDRLQTGEASSDSESSTTSVTYINKLTLNFTPNSTGNYLINWSAELANSSEKNSTYCRVQQGGANIAGDFVARSGGIVGAYLPCSGIKVSALTALTAYAFTIDYCAELTTAYIRNARIVIKKI